MESIIVDNLQSVNFQRLYEKMSRSANVDKPINKQNGRRWKKERQAARRQKQQVQESAIV